MLKQTTEIAIGFMALFIGGILLRLIIDNPWERMVAMMAVILLVIGTIQVFANFFLYDPKENLSK